MDDIGKTALSDPIIIEYGMRLLQTAKNIKKKMPAVRNKMRECARFLLKFKEIQTEPDSFVTVIETERSFKAASYALHQGKTLKDLIDIAIYLICKKDPIINENSLKHSSYILDSDEINIEVAQV
ncbi:hypothetical protein FQR65_LT17561 [Abscondita terminalis]|nr:hypothetical protein FQR65_LT17561 [Abscondita terminalis]